MNNLNVANRTIFCDDNLDVMRGINDQCIDLIYLDPPFNKNKKFTAPVGSSAEGASFDDIFREEDLKQEWLWTIREDQPDLYHYLEGIKGVGKPYNFAYLAYMAIRLIECRRILKDTGSIYLHCDPTMSHYLKTTMDCIFGEDNFRNEIVWGYTGPGSPKMRQFNRKHDIIFWYSKGKKWTFNRDDVRIPHKDGGPHSGGFLGEMDDELSEDYGEKGKIPETWWVQEQGNGLAIAARQKNQYVGYPTQKPIALLERIIRASSNEGDVVLDPFCGCATTCVTAEKLDRQWIGIDVSAEAYRLVRERLEKEVDKPQIDLFKGEKPLNMRTDPPVRTDLGKDYREKKFVYVISHPNFDGEYKVGIAKNWKSRLNSYQTSDPERQYQIQYKLETPWFRETEQYIHDLFPNKHEWVQGKLDDIIKAIEDHKPVPKSQDELDLS